MNVKKLYEFLKYTACFVIYDKSYMINHLVYYSLNVMLGLSTQVQPQNNFKCPLHTNYNKGSFLALPDLAFLNSDWVKTLYD